MTERSQLSRREARNLKQIVNMTRMSELRAAVPVPLWPYHNHRVPCVRHEWPSALEEIHTRKCRSRAYEGMATGRAHVRVTRLEVPSHVVLSAETPCTRRVGACIRPFAPVNGADMHFQVV